MSIVERIKETLVQKGLSMRELEQKLGFGRAAIYKWDKNSPSVDKIIAVSNFLHVSLSWLATGKAEENSDRVVDENTQKFLQDYKKLSDLDRMKIKYFMEVCLINVPEVSLTYTNIEETDSQTDTIKESPAPYVIDSKDIAVLGYVAAGQPIEGISIPLGYISAPVSADYALIAKGHSMEPVIQDGEYIFVRNCDALDAGDIGIFYIDGDVTCKQYSPDDSNVILKSLNPDFKPFKYPLNEQHDFKIQGKVILTNEQKQRLD